MFRKNYLQESEPISSLDSTFDFSLSTSPLFFPSPETNPSHPSSLFPLKITKAEANYIIVGAETKAEAIKNFYRSFSQFQEF